MFVLVGKKNNSKSLFLFIIQERLEKAEKLKADLQVCKLSADEEYDKQQDELTMLTELERNLQKESIMSRDTHEVWRRLTALSIWGIAREVLVREDKSRISFPV